MTDPIMQEMSQAHAQAAKEFREIGKEEAADWHDKHSQICLNRAHLSSQPRNGDTIPLQELVSPRRSELVAD